MHEMGKRSAVKRGDARKSRRGAAWRYRAASRETRFIAARQRKGVRQDTDSTPGESLAEHISSRYLRDKEEGIL